MILRAVRGLLEPVIGTIAVLPQISQDAAGRREIIVLGVIDDVNHVLVRGCGWLHPNAHPAEKLNALEERSVILHMTFLKTQRDPSIHDEGGKETRVMFEFMEGTEDSLEQFIRVG